MDEPRGEHLGGWVDQALDVRLSVPLSVGTSDKAQKRQQMRELRAMRKFKSNPYPNPQTLDPLIIRLLHDYGLLTHKLLVQLTEQNDTRIVRALLHLKSTKQISFKRRFRGQNQSPLIYWIGREPKEIEHKIDISYTRVSLELALIKNGYTPEPSEIRRLPHGETYTEPDYPLTCSFGNTRLFFPLEIEHTKKTDDFNKKIQGYLDWYDNYVHAEENLYGFTRMRVLTISPTEELTRLLQRLIATHPDTQNQHVFLFKTKLQDWFVPPTHPNFADEVLGNWLDCQNNTHHLLE